MTTKATLVTYSQPPPVGALQGGSLVDWIAYCARVSNPSNQTHDGLESSERLVKYLASHKHWSPFEMVSVCIEVVTTRDIARQLLRHRSFSFQEFSQRYAEVQEDAGFVVREARLQDWKNRQNSVELPVGEEEADALRNDWNNIQRQVGDFAQTAYRWALEQGVAKEVARSVLPEGMTPSRLYVNGSLRSWIHYVELRSGNGTQKEHRELALACAAALEPVFPMIRAFVLDA